MLITAFELFRPKGHREPRNEVESLSPTERLVGFEPGTFRSLSQRLNPLGHYPQDYARICLNFNNSYLPESRNKSSQELQKLALSSNPAGIYLFKFKQKKH